MRQYAPIYRPDMIVFLFFCGNDFMENDPVTFGQASWEDVEETGQTYLDNGLVKARAVSSH